MKLTYNGSDERVFPSLGLVLKQGDEFDAPEGFSHPDCTAKINKRAMPTTPSVASDLTKQESE